MKKNKIQIFNIILTWQSRESFSVKSRRELFIEINCNKSKAAAKTVNSEIKILKCVRY